MAVALLESTAPPVQAGHTIGERMPDCMPDWRAHLPTLTSGDLVLRELRLSDAGSLLTMIGDDDVARFLAPPPKTRSAFKEFIRWTHVKRAEGLYACFAVVPRGTAAAIGFFQLRALDPGFTAAEWGFAIGRPYWGTGIFAAGAKHLLTFAFDQIGVHRLEARAMAGNLRGNGALRKMGAVREGVLRESFTLHGQRHDTQLWSILEEDWRARPRTRPVTLVLPSRQH
jgi:[ribosomal protein S5]-alanine N-acetyltransferase